VTADIHAPVDHWVYVHFDADRKALYVGMTKNMAQRQAAHKRSWWFKDIEDCVTYGPYPTWYLAHEVECLAIRAWSPRFNVNNYPSKSDEFRRCSA
jgi:excinuclease UvrABC nuclease subunit